MIIRDARQADLPFFASANAALASETEGQTLDGALLGPGIQSVLDDPALGRYCLAEMGGQAIGQFMTTCEWSDWRNGVLLWIQSVYVLPGYRSRGVFRAPFEHLGLLARGDPRMSGIRRYFDRNNPDARQLYARLGMHCSSYGVMETVHRGPESLEEAMPC